jgi:aryl-alcohol dehydrogenase-like predicted oxidoreductase
VHRFDAGTPAGETMAALDDIVRSGRARYLGVSAMYAWQLAKLPHAAAAAALAVRLSGAEQARLEAGYQARLLSDY